MNMIRQRWAVKDLALVAVSVTAITLGLWSAAPLRQMIHCSDADGNTRSFSLPLGDSRLARIGRELQRRQTPPPVNAVVLAKWRIDLAAHYTKRCEAERRRGLAAKLAVEESSVGAGEAAGRLTTASHHVAQASFSDRAGAAAAAAVSGEGAEEREAAFWQNVAARAQVTLAQAETQVANQLAHAAPPPVVLGTIVAPGRSLEAWVTATLLGLLAACLFAEWAYRSPAIEVVPRHPETKAGQEDEIRIEIPSDWIRIHQPLDVWARRGLIAGLVAAACSLSLV